MKLRRRIQFLSAFMMNAYWLFPMTKSIYQGPLKSICVPVLNCYSCPAAIGACPIGSLQLFMAHVRPALASGHLYLGLSVFGMLGIIGTLSGRWVCGWICPFGLLQDIMHKIPSLKMRIPQRLSYVKYGVLCVFVILLPLVAVDEFGYGSPWFCKYICPAGTLEASIPMLILQPEIKELIGILFYFKLAILILFLAAMIMVSRPFCRIACPLGAFYSLFNHSSLLKMQVDPNICTQCDACYADCPAGVHFYESPNHRDCIRCFNCKTESCKFKAISWKMM